MKIKYILTSIIIFALALFVGCTNNKPTENTVSSSGVNATKLLTLKDVTEIFSKNGIDLIENYHNERPILKYKGPQIASFHPFSFEYKGAGSGGDFSTDGPYPLDKDGYVHGAISSSNSPLHDINLPYSMTIHWNDNQETIELTVD